MQHACLDVNLEPILIHLSETNEVRGEVGDVVDSIQPAMFTRLARDEHGAFALYASHRPITELDGTGVALSSSAKTKHVPVM